MRTATRIGVLLAVVAALLVLLLPAPRRFVQLELEETIPITTQSVASPNQTEPPTNVRWTLDHVPLSTPVDWDLLRRAPGLDPKTLALAWAAVPTAGPMAVDEAEKLAADSPEDPAAQVAVIESLARGWLGIVAASPKPADLTRLRAAADAGLRAEPRNAFFDLVRAYALLQAGDKAGAVAAVRAAAAKPTYNPHEREIADELVKAATTAGVARARAQLSARTLLAQLPHHMMFRRLTAALLTGATPARDTELLVALTQVGDKIRTGEPTAQGILNGAVIEMTASQGQGAETLDVALRRLGRAAEANRLAMGITAAAQQRGIISTVYNTSKPTWLSPQLRASLLWYYLAVIIVAAGLCLVVGLIASISSPAVRRRQFVVPAWAVAFTVAVPVAALAVEVVSKVRPVWGNLEALATMRITPQVYNTWTGGTLLLMVAAAALAAIQANRAAGRPGFGRLLVRIVSAAWPWVVALLLIGIILTSQAVAAQEDAASRTLGAALGHGEAELIMRAAGR
jgi:hypothetical protein